MKYVIWGCGHRGKILSLLFEDNTIAAFIDRDKEKIGSEFQNIKVISFEDYLKRFSNYPVIIAVKWHEEEISSLLDSNNIPWLLVDTIECIPILYQIQVGIDKILDNNPQGKCIIYGYNLYGAYLYYLLKKRNRICQIVLQDGISPVLEKTVKDNVNLADKSEIYKDDNELIFTSLSLENEISIDKVGKPIIDVYEVYKYDQYFFNSELIKFKNIHKGKRCFIIANGPSLRMDDLMTLYEHKEICFGVNGIHYAFSKVKWRPDYYFVDCGYSVNVRWYNEILNMEAKEIFVADTAWHYTTQKIPQNMHVFHVYTDEVKNEPKFSEDFSKGVYWGGSIIYVGPLQMAVYMGFTEIYLIGADCTKEGKADDFYFTKDYAPEQKRSYLNLDEVFGDYRSAKRYCDQHQISIYNATRGGDLEILDRVDFDSLF